MKKCSVCLEHKPLKHFYSNGKQPSGKQKYKPSCKRCEMATRYAKYVAAIEEFYGELVCGKCGYDRSFAALQLHHRHPAEKDHTIANMACHSKGNLFAELKKCDLLCANCHAEHHFNE